MWDNRQLLLSQALNYQMFQRDARQADSILNQQENFLTKVEQPVSQNFHPSFLIKQTRNRGKQKINLYYNCYKIYFCLNLYIMLLFCFA